MKKQMKALSMLMALVMVIGVVFSVVCFADGQKATTITPDTSWYLEKSKTKTATLRDAADLAGFAQLCTEDTQYFYGWTIKLGKDIVYNEGNAADFATTAPANVYTPPVEFWGTFDGQGYVISGLYFNDVTKRDIGLFSSLNGATVKNVSVVNSYFAGSRMMGGITGTIKEVATTISNCYTDAILYANPGETDGAYAGGIAGYNTAVGTVIENCWYAGALTTESDTDNMATKVGGILGGSTVPNNAGSAKIKDCLMTGSVTAQSQAGGIVGVARDMDETGTVLENCLMLGSVRLTRDSKTLFVGQFACVWKNSGKITLTNVFGLNTYEATIDTTKFTGDKTTKVWNVSGTGVIVADTSATVAADSLKGDTAKTTLASFDFDGEDAIWATVAEGTPVIKALATIDSTKASCLEEAPIDPTELEVEGDGNGESNEGGNTGADNGDAPKDTDATDTDATDTDAAGTEATGTEAKVAQDEKGGCGSSAIGMSAVVLVGACGAFIAKKKKEN